MPILRDWTDSVAVNSLDVHAERFFARLLQKCDDYGRFHAHPALTNSILFPLKRDIRDTDVARYIAACERAGIIRCYVDSSGRQLLQVVKWKDGKKFKQAKFESPNGQANLPLLAEPKKPPKEYRSRREVEAEARPPVLKKREVWQLLKDEAALTARIKHEAQSCKPDPALLEQLKAQRALVRDEIKKLKPNQP